MEDIRDEFFTRKRVLRVKLNEMDTGTTIRKLREKCFVVELLFELHRIVTAVTIRS